MPRSIALVLATLALWCAAAGAQENTDCLYCHEDQDLVVERGGKEFSGYVDQAVLDATVHALLNCVDCHTDLAGAELPHDWDVQPVDCSACHEDEGARHAASIHGQALAAGDAMAPSCADCHGHHDVLSPADPASPTAIMNIPATCGQCHKEGSPVSRTHDIDQDDPLGNYSQSIHGKGLYDKGLRVTAVCTSCHTSHDILPHEDPRSTINVDNVAATCTTCHAQIERVHRKVINGRLWEDEPHKIPSCVDCHEPHKVRQAYYPSGMANRDCMTCHAAQSLSMERDGETVSLYVNEGEYSVSVHAGTACAQCHTDVSPSLERPCATSTSVVDCSVCHADAVTNWQGGSHGALAAEGDHDAPTCLDCHGKHAVLKHTDPASPSFPRNVPALCSRCHAEGKVAAERIEGAGAQAVGLYMESIHGKGLSDSGLLVTATCSSCHGAHEVLPSKDPRSRVSRANVADTCGTCHYGIEERFRASIHWAGPESDRDDLPTCKDCHSSHSIVRTDVEAFRFSIMRECGECHREQADSFYDTFHGKASLLGEPNSAKCSDCHGTHEILPASNQASRLADGNVIATCGTCHSGSHRQFTGYLAHATHNDPERWPWLYWTYWAMTALLVGTMSMALAHTLLFCVRLVLDRKDWRAHQAAIRRGEGDLRIYRRFDRYQRMMHLLMVISFLTLAATGMLLKFSYTPWAKALAGGLGGFVTTGTLHRLAAMLLVGVFIWHVRSALRAKREQQLTWAQVVTAPNSILFNWGDWSEAKATIAWFFGRGKRPRFGRFIYWEKFDYFAVFWGVVIIGLTGLSLWFPEMATLVLPGWTLNVATIVHGDEALLAVAFIFTVHFFNANLRPDKFPMDPVIFTGRMTVEELKYERPAEYQHLVDSGALEGRIVEPLPRAAERSARVFGSAALLVGLTLIGLIIHALLTA